MNRREAILEATLAATRLHEQLQIRAATEATCGSVDVFRAYLTLEVPLIFRPIKGLLGAAVLRPRPGVLVSTQRPLSIQRFTGAHELGHISLQHALSLDGEEILGSIDAAGLTVIELQANAFAAEFLMPRWLLAFHAKRQGWNRDSLRDPSVVYQLSLRLGTSYESTCRALGAHKLIDAALVSQHLAIEPRTIKRSLLANYEPQDWRRDVWLLTRLDEGATIEGQPDDLFVVRLSEKASAGYLWDLDGLKQQGFVVVLDTRDSKSAQGLVGGPVTRTITIRSQGAVRGTFTLELRRPWQKALASAEQIHINYDLQGKEVGYARAYRRRLQEAMHD